MQSCGIPDPNVSSTRLSRNFLMAINVKSIIRKEHNKSAS